MDAELAKDVQELAHLDGGFSALHIADEYVARASHSGQVVLPESLAFADLANQMAQRLRIVEGNMQGAPAESKRPFRF